MKMPNFHFYENRSSHNIKVFGLARNYPNSQVKVYFSVFQCRALINFHFPSRCNFTIYNVKVIVMQRATEQLEMHLQKFRSSLKYNIFDFIYLIDALCAKFLLKLLQRRNFCNNYAISAISRKIHVCVHF